VHEVSFVQKLILVEFAVLNYSAENTNAGIVKKLVWLLYSPGVGDWADMYVYG
jgi:hypothetical protein